MRDDLEVPLVGLLFLQLETDTGVKYLILYPNIGPLNTEELLI